MNIGILKIALPLLLEGLKTTICISILAILLSFIFGGLIGILYISKNKPKKNILIYCKKSSIPNMNSIILIKNAEKLYLSFFTIIKLYMMIIIGWNIW